MTRSIVYVVFIVIATSCATPRLTFNTLVKFSGQDKASIGRTLEKMNWEFQSDKSPDSSYLGKSVWAYKPTGENADAWCVLYYSESTPNRVLYNFNGESINKKLLSKIVQRNMEVVETGDALPGVVNLASYTDYADDEYVVRQMAYTQPGHYGMKLFKKEDYLKAKSKGGL